MISSQENVSPKVSLSIFADKKEKKTTPYFILHDHFLKSIQKQIFNIYADLPVPSQLTSPKVCLYNTIGGGHGDYSAADKVIEVFNSTIPDIEINWSPNRYPEIAKKFRAETDHLKINLAGQNTEAINKCDLVLIGPVSDSPIPGYIRNIIENKPRFNFNEICDDGYLVSLLAKLNTSFTKILGKDFSIILKTLKNFSFEDEKDSLFSFKELPNEIQTKVMNELIKTILESIDTVAMGLDENSGIFVDHKKLEQELSNRYFSPEALLKIENEILKKFIFLDILNNENSTYTIEDVQKLISKESLNFGYAHYTNVKGKYIDLCCAHEKNKNCTFFLYQTQKGTKETSVEYFKEKVLTEERLNHLKDQGYGKIIIRSQEVPEGFCTTIEGSEPSSRTITVNLIPWFSRNDIQNLQMGCERLLATGDNSACEAFESRFKFYMYEDISTTIDVTENIGSSPKKKYFLNQQIQLAKKISPSIGKLMKISSRAKNFTPEKLQKAVQLFKEPEIEESYLEFAQTILKNHDFNQTLIGMIKRKLWLLQDPKLLEIEKEYFMSDSVLNPIIKHVFFEQTGKNSSELEMTKAFEGMKNKIQTRLTL